jgi:hypothetical protein
MVTVLQSTNTSYGTNQLRVATKEGPFLLYVARVTYRYKKRMGLEGDPIYPWTESRQNDENFPGQDAYL